MKPLESMLLNTISRNEEMLVNSRICSQDRMHSRERKKVIFHEVVRIFRESGNVKVKCKKKKKGNVSQSRGESV